MNSVFYIKVQFNKILGLLLFVFQNKIMDQYFKNQIKKDGITLIILKNKILSIFQQDIMNRFFHKEDTKYTNT